MRHRCANGDGQVWVFRDPGRAIVGYGSTDVRLEYADYAGGKPHSYISLIAVHPTHQGRGYGGQIVRHLVNEAAIAAAFDDLSEYLFLDVYDDNAAAISLYRRHQFVVLEDEPSPDPDEGGRPYLIMARRIDLPI